MLLFAFSTLVAASTALLIFAGGLVTSTGSGLSVPDWPTTYGWFMFTFPIDQWVGGIKYEHSHRLIASTVGFFIVVLAFWLWRVEPRRWVRRLGYLALGAVIVQGVLGGITVLWYLPDAISVAHASLAQIVFCLTATIALATSPGWKRGYAAGTRCETTPDDRLLQRLGLVTSAAIFLQIVVGAVMRHTHAGMAIPDFPLAFGRLIPPFWNTGIAIHFTHRVGAVVVSLLLLAMAGHVFHHHRTRGELVRPAALLLALLTAQITLGAYNIWLGLPYIVNSLHVLTGATILVTTLVLTLRAHRARLGDMVVARDGTASAPPPAIAPHRAGVRA